MGIYDGTEFTIKEKAERGIELPEILAAHHIVELWHEDKREREIIIKIMLRALKNQKLKLQPDYFFCSTETETVIDIIYERDEMIYVRWGDNEGCMVYFDPVAKISRMDFIAWLKGENEPLPTACLLENWWKDLGLQTVISTSASLIANDPVNHDVINDNSYARRKASCDSWLKERNVEIKSLSVEDIYNQLKLFDKKVWNFRLASFRKDFWQKYSKENHLQKTPGRPPD